MDKKSLTILWGLIAILTLLIINTFINFQYTIHTEPMIEENNKDIQILKHRINELEGYHL